MKKYLLIFVMLLTGCLKTSDRHPDTKMVIGFSQCTMIDEWRKTMVEEMRREIAFIRNYRIELIVKDAGDNNDKQIADINELVSK
ncbi:MAG: hypothetical protein LLG05_02575, partial [Porphyromonadaceae bacterium]|nr:hypothetical protein [Porphyromonadaceae bacterium]